MENEINGKYVVITSKFNCQDFPLNEKAIFVSYEDLEKIDQTNGTKCFDLENNCVVDYDNTIDKIIERRNELRARRQSICFPIINRGQLWYDTLTKLQKEELSSWYQNWLDVTVTLEEPVVPEFLFKELEKFYIVEEPIVDEVINEIIEEEIDEEVIDELNTEEAIV